MTKAKIIKWDETPENDFGVVRTRAFLDTSEVPGLSLSWIYKQEYNENELSKIDHCDTAYFIVSGEGFVLIDGEKHPIGKGDVLYVPRGAEYETSEGLEMIAACNPRFGRD